ncbi:LPXTG cell wall anchor domain-containing protein [Lentzea sp. BCCO 10_0798]|uniref:LPXTG cell wall anchor domain-containing protein n=1 Tax=Lentzea kristufekii TaxID=3095430 RepID=A0ABU4U543_9PSEU|nr:LPXTG cell wall anchor domain-containing protein [Lentzea sp. BCCO 10_0798]MDX8055690.1 LPXTG cell wall anchor domain-containing protein [Lentzea sp. BCCO 10_0798]
MASRVLGVLAVAAVATLAAPVLATPAGAHVPTASAECVKDKAVLTVDLRYYAPEEKNTVLVKAGAEVLVDKKFGKSYSDKFTLDGTVAHTFTVVVKAYDDARYNLNGTYKTPPCVVPPKPSSSVPPKPSSSVPPKPSSSVPAPSSSVAVPSSSTTPPPLAATGASPAWLLLGGLGLVGAGAVAMLVVRRRRA